MVFHTTSPWCSTPPHCGVPHHLTVVFHTTSSWCTGRHSPKTEHTELVLWRPPIRIRIATRRPSHLENFIKHIQHCHNNNLLSRVYKTEIQNTTQRKKNRLCPTGARKGSPGLHYFLGSSVPEKGGPQTGSVIPTMPSTFLTPKQNNNQHSKT